MWCSVGDCLPHTQFRAEVESSSLFTYTNLEPLQALQIIFFPFKNNLNFRYIKKNVPLKRMLPLTEEHIPSSVHVLWKCWRHLGGQWIEIFLEKYWSQDENWIGWVEITFKSSGICWHIQIREIIFYICKKFSHQICTKQWLGIGLSSWEVGIIPAITFESKLARVGVFLNSWLHRPFLIYF